MVSPDQIRFDDLLLFARPAADTCQQNQVWLSIANNSTKDGSEWSITQSQATG